MVKTRFAPSPTGYLHVGGARTALFAYLFAKRQQGQFMLRIEDTDRARSTQASTQAILDDLTWLGLVSDEPLVYQSERFDWYHQQVRQLLDQSLAYRCACSQDRLAALRAEQLSRGEKPKYDGRCRNRAIAIEQPHVIRFANPQQGTVSFHDAVYGVITVANEELDDMILVRSDGTPTYNLTATLDDMIQGVTHVLRGDDHLNNTPRQMNLLRALGSECPTYAHLPMILNEQGQRLSKRHDAVSVAHYRQMGVVPEAMINDLARLGWSHGDQEIFSMDDLLQRFSLEAIHRAPATFTLDKLLWFNQHYLKNSPPATYQAAFEEQVEALGGVLALSQQTPEVLRLLMGTTATLRELAQKVLFIYQSDVAWDESHNQHMSTALWSALDDLLPRLTDVAWNTDDLSQLIKQTVKAHSLRFPQLAQPLRIFLTGGAASPSIDQTLFLLGRERSLQRIRAGRSHFEHRASSAGSAKVML